MLIRPITYRDIDDKEVTGNFYFNLNEEELARIEFAQKGGFEKQLKQYIADGDENKLLDTFELLIKLSIGVRKTDEVFGSAGLFVKTPEIAEAFKQTNAYSALFMELMTSPEKAVEFFVAVMPPQFREKMLEPSSNEDFVTETVGRLTEADKQVEVVPSKTPLGVVVKDPVKPDITGDELLALLQELRSKKPANAEQ